MSGGRGAGTMSGGRASPWPAVEVAGDLTRARVEWLHGNGAGAYASSTVAQLNTRRYHGLLVAALDPPRGRHVLLSHLDVEVETHEARYELSTHQFPHIEPTDGYRHLARFAQDPLPRFLWTIAGDELEQTFALARGLNALVVRWTWRGRAPVALAVRPLLSMRPFHALQREHGAMHQSVELRQGEVRVRPVGHLPRVVFGHSATFIGSPDWWRRFEYLTEHARGLDFQEDLWTPGVFRMRLEPGDTTHLVVAADALPARAPSDLLDEAALALVACDPGPRRSLLVRKLSIAADAYRADLAQTPGIVAGYPWFEVWGRDSLIALPGLYLATDRVASARRVLATLTQTMADGLVPNRLPDVGGEAEYHTADATLWLFEAARLYAERVGSGDGYLRGELFDALHSAFEAAMAGTRHHIHVTPEGLFAAGDPGFALTWMDARVGDWVVTPRAGLPVELQALWVRACDTLASLAVTLGDDALASRAREAHVRGLAAFRARFWCEATGYPYDVLPTSPDADQLADASIRPNALIALAVEPRLFDPTQAARILAVVERDLLTPVGVRTLAPGSPGYVGRYGGGVRARDAAYHQGTAWPFLLGFYVRAARRLRPLDEALREALERLVASAFDHQLALGQVPEISDGDAPFGPNGCSAQAWSVAELLRAAAWDLA